MRINNPALKAFSRVIGLREGVDHMTVQGTVAKLAVSLLMTVLAGSISWWCLVHGYQIAASVLVGIGMIGGFALALVTILKPQLSAKTVPLYALCKGFTIGTFSAVAETVAPGTALIAVGLTSGTAAAFLLAYQFGLVRATENVRLMIISATGGVAFTYLFALILSFFGIRAPFIHDSSIYGIIFSLVVVAIAAFNLILDFDFIERCSENDLPKYMEWYGAFAVLLTLLWVYVEIVRLLLKLRKRR